MKPVFPKSACYNYFQSQCSCPSGAYQGLPEWIPQIMPTPDIEAGFDCSPITPCQVKSILRKCSSSSTPGPDSISYFHLWQLPSCHHFLATLYSKILQGKQPGPKSWYSGRIILIHKSGNPSLPSNFRPIALKSCIGKHFHRIIARRLEKFLLANNIIDTSVQKGFLSGVNGTMEHLFALNSLLENVRLYNLPIFVTFLDLKNAFGSVPHNLILDMLSHIQLPSEVTSYIAQCYSKLEAQVSTKEWSTSHFAIRRGIFQGDTLSPLLFLIAFQPVIKLAGTLEPDGYRLQLAIPESEGLPPPDSFIYVEWDVEESDEPKGWYLCRVMEYFTNGLARLEYQCNLATEVLDLKSVQWHLTRKSCCKFLSLSKTPPVFTLKKVREEARKTKMTTSTCHKTKAFADDLTVISSSLTSHKEVLEATVEKCQDIDLHVRPDKCVSILYNGKKLLENATVQLPTGRSCSIHAAPTKFLGGNIAHNR